MPILLEPFLFILTRFAAGIFCADKKEIEERYGLSVKLSTAVSVKNPSGPKGLAFCGFSRRFAPRAMPHIALRHKTVEKLQKANKTEPI